MGEFQDRLDRLVVEARSPDGGIRAAVRGRNHVAVGFTPGCYGRYAGREPELARQLGQLATLTWTRYRRDHSELLDDHLEHPLRTEDPADRRFRERLEQIRIGVTSTGRWITVETRALVRWDVTVRDGAVRALGENEFVREIDSAVSAVLVDYRAQAILLTDEVYDIGLPRSLRRSTAAR